MFITPLLLLPLLASSYAEVNYEGVKCIQVLAADIFLLVSHLLFQSILPTEKRVHMFQYLYGHPIQMTVYGHAISYGTIGKLFIDNFYESFSKLFVQALWSPASWLRLHQRSYSKRLVLHEKEKSGGSLQDVKLLQKMENFDNKNNPI